MRAHELSRGGVIAATQSSLDTTFAFYFPLVLPPSRHFCRLLSEAVKAAINEIVDPGSFL